MYKIVVLETLQLGYLWDNYQREENLKYYMESAQELHLEKNCIVFENKYWEKEFFQNVVFWYLGFTNSSKFQFWI